MAPMLTIFEENPSQLLKDHRMYYLLVNSISRRVRQLQLGEKALAVPPDGHRDAIRVATQEFLEDQLEIIPKNRTNIGGPGPSMMDGSAEE